MTRAQLEQTCEQMRFEAEIDDSDVFLEDIIRLKVGFSHEIPIESNWHPCPECGGTDRTCSLCLGVGNITTRELDTWNERLDQYAAWQRDQANQEKFYSQMQE